MFQLSAGSRSFVKYSDLAKCSCSDLRIVHHNGLDVVDGAHNH